MFRGKAKKGFTLAELLIVIAIIAILIAIAIPVFSSSMRRANESTDCANIRALKAAAVAFYLDNEAGGTYTYPVTLFLCQDGQAREASDLVGSGGTSLTYKLDGSDNTQLAALGITADEDYIYKGGAVMCQVDADGVVSFTGF